MRVGSRGGFVVCIRAASIESLPWIGASRVGIATRARCRSNRGDYFASQRIILSIVPLYGGLSRSLATSRR